MADVERRREAIVGLILRHRVGSQEGLLDLLTGMGFHLTQATLSRDLRALKIGKVVDAMGAFYTVPAMGSWMEDIRRGFRSLEFSGNLGVLKTLSGHANSIAVVIDGLERAEVLGTVAGDDTVLVVLRDGGMAGEFRGFIEGVMGDTSPGIRRDLRGDSRGDLSGDLKGVDV